MRLLALLILFPLSGLAQSKPPTQPVKTTESIPRTALEPMYKAELGAKYDPKRFDPLYSAHLLQEEYFQNPQKRKEIVKSLESSGVDPNVLGRLVRIRLHWPDLKGGVYYINEKLGPHEVRYFIGLPREYDRAKPWPLVIKLPAADAFLGNPMPDADQVKNIYTQWMTDELSQHPDAIVIMPLLNFDELWGPSYAGMNNAIQPILHAADRVNIDPARVHLLGHSMSAHAVWNLALHYPTYVASFCAFAGAAGSDWQRVRVMCLRNVLAVSWHDEADRLIPIGSARRLVRVLKQMKVPIEFEETKDLGHVPSDSIVQKCYEKMRARVRELYPKQVALQSNRPDTLFNRNDWVQIYQPLKPGEDRRLYFQRGSGFMVLNQGLWKVEATLSNNRIDATTTNVEALRFYLNDQMVDLSRPVTVNINKKGRFEGIVKMSIDEMLKDQLFLGRGWRYYTAVVDIDFGGPPSIPPAGRPATRPTTTPAR
jgi:hypothetical protein